MYIHIITMVSADYVMYAKSPILHIQNTFTKYIDLNRDPVKCLQASLGHTQV